MLCESQNLTCKVERRSHPFSRFQQSALISDVITDQKAHQKDGVQLVRLAVRRLVRLVWLPGCSQE